MIAYASTTTPLAAGNACKHPTDGRPLRIPVNHLGLSFVLGPGSGSSPPPAAAAAAAMASHSPDRHACHCGKSFLRKEHLRRHQATHGGPTFSCQVCGRSFSRR
ncbi:hypothetical protein CDD83_5724 [Cordyceps sp. RAO-2017]|nr:hypothetical protein CDD83_5724 [Cordyceps sp. RAO-2017]